jgi:hypothetical protein
MMVPTPLPENPLPPKAWENLGSTSWKFLIEQNSAGLL